MELDVRFPASLEARLVRRENRFVVRAVAGGKELRLHLPNTGRLAWLASGTRLRYLPRSGGRTEGRVLLARDGAVWALLDSAYAEAGLPRMLARWGWSFLAAQPRVEGSRLDALVRDAAGRERWLELKSVTHVEGGTACFPDAPSARALRHLRLLARHRGALVFAVLRADAERFAPCPVDPAFASALCGALEAGLWARAVRARVEPAGLVWDAELPLYCGA
ncbi:DNA/RNA nuclease SfsA [Oceanithermus sp.]|uniref:DNA/RNA nuclease SfsA n=1 Tax=Oceanithermus sp. TaxID=2268145 RepID=UPI00257E0A0D|nr:DNA/RNA nuclease SfsA [Oceanithermus sp.]